MPAVDRVVRDTFFFLIHSPLHFNTLAVDKTSGLVSYPPKLAELKPTPNFFENLSFYYVVKLTTTN